MRLAYLSAVSIPSRTASSIQVVHMSGAFARYGCNVTLYARPGIHGDAGAALSQYGVEANFALELIQRPQLGPLGAHSYALRCRKRLAKNEKPDVLYGRHWPTLAAAARRVSAPIAFEAHGLPNAATDRLVQRYLFRMPQFRCLVVISKTLKDDYLEAFPELRDKDVLVAHDGAPRALRRDSGTGHGGREECRRFRGAARLQVGYVGSLHPGKGMELIERLADRLHEVDFHVFGSETSGIPSWQERIRNDNVHFHGWIPHSDLGRAYSSFDVALIPMQRVVRVGNGKDIGKWTSPLKLFESMAYAKAILTSDVPVIREVVTPGVDALVCAPEDVDCWVSALLELNDVGRRRTLAENAHSTFVRHYTWEVRARRILERLE